jgi:hypothetical protein
MTFPSFDVLPFSKIIPNTLLCFILFTAFLVALYSFFHTTDSGRTFWRIRRRDAKMSLLVWLKLCQHVTTRYPMKGLLWIFIMGSFTRILRHIPVLVQIVQEDTLDRRVYMHFCMYLEHN